MEIIKKEIENEKKRPRFPWVILTILLILIGFVAFLAISAVHFAC